MTSKKEAMPEPVAMAAYPLSHPGGRASADDEEALGCADARRIAGTTGKRLSSSATAYTKTEMRIHGIVSERWSVGSLVPRAPNPTVATTSDCRLKSWVDLQGLRPRILRRREGTAWR
jgi:hypothetical protein